MLSNPKGYGELTPICGDQGARSSFTPLMGNKVEPAPKVVFYVLVPSLPGKLEDAEAMARFSLNGHVEKLVYEGRALFACHLSARDAMDLRLHMGDDADIFLVEVFLIDRSGARPMNLKLHEEIEEISPDMARSVAEPTALPEGES